MRVHGICLAIISIWPLGALASATNVDLGTSDAFAVLGSSTVTNTGPTVVHGDMGVWPGAAVTGWPPGVDWGTTHIGDGVVLQAHSDLATAYNFAAGEAAGTILTGQDLGGLTLTPGVYDFASSAQLSGILTLDSLGDPNAVFLFQIGSTLTTASGSSVLFVNGGTGDSVFWQVGSSATLGTATSFAGNILALASITLNHAANISCGRALAINGAVTMDTNAVSIDSGNCETSPVGVPEPAAWAMMLLGFGLVGGRIRRRNAARV